MYIAQISNINQGNGSNNCKRECRAIAIYLPWRQQNPIYGLSPMLSRILLRINWRNARTEESPDALPQLGPTSQTDTDVENSQKEKKAWQHQ